MELDEHEDVDAVGDPLEGAPGIGDEVEPPGSDGAEAPPEVLGDGSDGDDEPLLPVLGEPGMPALPLLGDEGAPPLLLESSFLQPLATSVALMTSATSDGRTQRVFTFSVFIASYPTRARWAHHPMAHLQ
jgi:hypothetical protein